MEKENNQLYDFGTDAIIIARVSTPEQILNPNLSPQINDLKEYAKLYRYKKLQTFGTTESGFLKEDDKQGWNLVTNFIEKNPSYKTIICTSMDRLGREDEILIHIKNYLIKNKIQLLIKDINFELLNRFGEIDQGKDIIFGLYASLAAAEMRTKKERFKRALREYRKIGYSIGGKRLFGYERICDGGLGKKRTYIINPTEEEEIKTIYDWYVNGIDRNLTITSIARIAFECKARGFSKYLHSKRNVNKCLKEKAYTGFKITKNKTKNPQFWNYKDKSAKKYVNAESYECTYPRIISDELFDTVQHKLSIESTHYTISNNVFVDKSRKHTTILAKIIVCPYCGKFYMGDYRYKDGYIKHTYRCSNAKGKLLRKCDNTQTISMVMMDSSVWAFVKAKVEDITAQMNMSKNEINLDEIREEIERLKSDYDRFDDDIEAENIIFRTSIRVSKDKGRVQKEYEKKIRKIENNRKNLERVIAERERLLKIAIEEASSKSNLDEAVKNNIDRIESDKNEMYKYVHLLIKSVIPVYSDRRYTVLEIISFNNLKEVLDYGKEDVDGLPYIKGEKHDNVYYVCIDKYNANNIKCRLITDNLLSFDFESKDFYLGEKHYSVSHIFDINLEETDPTRYSDLQMGVEVLPYKKLTFYDVDNINA